MDKWDHRFMGLAKEISTWSKDEVKVGALIASGDKRKFSVGYNGFPRYLNDATQNPEDRVTLAVHAELNAVLNCGFDLFGTTIYVTKTPCLECAKAIIQAGIVRVVCHEPVISSSWFHNQLKAMKLLADTGRIVEFYEDENEKRT